MAVLAILAVGYSLAVNILAFALFGIDKRRAAAGAWRIPEAVLIRAALAGGWPGAKAGQRRFRHKTRKQPFARRLNTVGVLQLALLLVLSGLALSPSVDLGAGVDRLTQATQSGLSQLGLSYLAAQAPQEDADASPRPVPRRFGPGSEGGDRRPIVRPQPPPP